MATVWAATLDLDLVGDGLQHRGLSAPGTQPRSLVLNASITREIEFDILFDIAQAVSRLAMRCRRRDSNPRPAATEGV